MARTLRFSLKELLVQRRVALTASRDGAGAPAPEALDETDDERDEREDNVETSETIESGDEADDVDRAREDRRAVTGYLPSKD